MFKHLKVYFNIDLIGNTNLIDRIHVNGKHLLIVCISLLSFSLPTISHAEDLGPRKFDDLKPINQFIKEMVQKHTFKQTELEELFQKVKLHPSILKAISRPAEGKPWYDYRPIFVTKSRIKGGLKFWEQHKIALEQANNVYGVPKEIIASIIGVETRYGRHTGRYPIIDSLSTLAFAYPPRSKFFKSELEHYLLMTREERLDPLALKGSYAGAMGLPQFISSSFRHYAVDFDKSGQRNLWESPTDAIGSVANYFKKHHWRTGEPIASKVTVHGERFRLLLSKGIKPDKTIQELLDNGVVLPNGLPEQLKGKLIAFETKTGFEYWVVWHNFYVISRYNHSALYSMAVFQLSEQISAQYNAE